MRILIANRGEIARRIQRSAHRMGHQTIAVFAPPDADAPYVGEASAAVSLGDSLDLAQTYLSIDAILAAARVTGADAIHPGYGFLAENPDFAQQCSNSGMLWIGPKPDAIKAMGSKIEARKLAEQAGAPVLPGFADSQDPAELAEAAAEIGWPILIKASAGGGGKGIRIARSATEFEPALNDATTEAERTFGDGTVILERYVERPRHIEVQIAGDHHGTVIDLGTRECSVQRRYQKLWEEAPAPNLTDTAEKTLRRSARDLAESIGYDSVGTVEFIVDDETQEPYFLEMNTRLQVEHTITEAITGVDLVELMIRTAEGAVLPSGGAGLVFEGHAIEARILAEDPSADFAPQTGTVHQVSVPETVRWDSAIEPGSEITPHYDSMVAKMIVHGSSRADAMTRMARALDDLIIDGPVTTAGFHRWLIDQDPMLNGGLTTRFVDENPLPDKPPQAVERAAEVWARTNLDTATQDRTNPWLGSSFSLTPHRSKLHVGLRDADGVNHEVSVDQPDDDAAPSGTDRSDRTDAVVDLAARRVAVNVEGWTQSYEVPTLTEFWAPGDSATGAGDGAAVAPFPAVVAEVGVLPGEPVVDRQVLVTIEAMKMLHPIKATRPGVVETVPVNVGDQVATGQTLVAFAAGESNEMPGEPEDSNSVEPAPNNTDDETGSDQA